MKRVIRLTEQDLHRVVRRTVRRLMNEDYNDAKNFAQNAWNTAKGYAQQGADYVNNRTRGVVDRMANFAKQMWKTLIDLGKKSRTNLRDAQKNYRGQIQTIVNFASLEDFKQQLANNPNLVQILRAAIQSGRILVAMNTGGLSAIILKDQKVQYRPGQGR